MTLEREHVAELFGLAGTFPRPGWVVLDAARDHRFTGELIFDVDPEVRVYFERGTIYLAERVTDPGLGARLVDAGALNAAELEHGSMLVGDAEHLGRLFDRVPSVDRQTTLVVTDMMNDTCVSWLARQHVRDVTTHPYRHHPSGVHRWQLPDGAVELRPGDPLPAPAPTDTPVDIEPPGSVFAGSALEQDPLVHWDEPSWLDDRTPDTRATETAPSVEAPGALLGDDWVDHLERTGLPETGADPLTPTATMAALPVQPPDHFELIWPSGEIDDHFPDSIGTHDDIDRAGPTARVARSAMTPAESPGPVDEPGLWDAETSSPSFGPGDDTPDASATADTDADDHGIDDTTADAAADMTGDPDADDVSLSVRRAVASIETGSLAARRRLADTPQADNSSRGTDLVVPGRVATRTEASLWNATRAETPTAPSVFDEPDPAPAATAARAEPTVTDAAGAAPAPDAEPTRVSALRRLIGGLRRR